MDQTKIYTTYFNPPRQELFNGGLRIFVALKGFSRIDLSSAYTASPIQP